MNEINEKVIKISQGKVFTDKILKLGDEVKLSVYGTVTKISQEDCQDGTYDLVFIVKVTEVEVLADE